MQYYYNIAIDQNDKTTILQYHFIVIPQNYNSTIHQCDNTSKQQNYNEVLHFGEKFGSDIDVAIKTYYTDYQSVYFTKKRGLTVFVVCQSPR